MKKYIVCLLVVVCLAFLSEKADAFSVQVRGGGIVAPVGNAGKTMTITQEGIDVFIYEGETVDIFVTGLIVNPFSQTSDNPNDNLAKQTIGASFYGTGLRYRFITGGWSKPYLSFGISMGTVDEEGVLNSNFTLTSGSTKHSSSFQAMKVGIGTDIPLGGRISMGIELDAYILSTAGGKYGTVRNNSTGSTSDLTSGAPPAMPGLTVGIRYHF